MFAAALNNKRRNKFQYIHQSGIEKFSLNPLPDFVRFEFKKKIDSINQRLLIVTQISRRCL